MADVKREPGYGSNRDITELMKHMPSQEEQNLVNWVAVIQQGLTNQMMASQPNMLLQRLHLLQQAFVERSTNHDQFTSHSTNHNPFVSHLSANHGGLSTHGHCQSTTIDADTQFLFPQGSEVEEIVVEVEPDDIKENILMEDEDDNPEDLNPPAFPSRSRNRFTCDVCNKSFNRELHLKTHMRVHTKEKPYQCDLCNKAFTQQGNLKTHRRLHRADEEVYPCSLCDRSFASPVDLVKHARKHNGEKPFQCNICFKYFSQSSGLRSHVRTHEGLKPYSCQICKKTFGQSSHLRGHMRIHTGEKPYECDICHREFSQKGNLQEHKKRIHI